MAACITRSRNENGMAPAPLHRLFAYSASALLFFSLCPSHHPTAFSISISNISTSISVATRVASSRRHVVSRFCIPRFRARRASMSSPRPAFASRRLILQLCWQAPKVCCFAKLAHGGAKPLTQAPLSEEKSACAVPSNSKLHVVAK